jgi:hypothetical protein
MSRQECKVLRGQPWSQYQASKTTSSSSSINSGQLLTRLQFSKSQRTKSGYHEQLGAPARRNLEFAADGEACKSLAIFLSLFILSAPSHFLPRLVSIYSKDEAITKAGPAAAGKQYVHLSNALPCPANTYFRRSISSFPSTASVPVPMLLPGFAISRSYQYACARFKRINCFNYTRATSSSLL